MTDVPTLNTPLSVLQRAAAKDKGKAFKPPAVERSDLHSRVLKRLRLAILTGELKPGDRIQQAALARAFGVSTSPLREAIRDLISAGLLDLEVYAGATVHVPSPSELTVVGEMRVALMPVTVAHAIERITDDELAQAERIVNQLQRTRPKAEWVELNREFHSLLDGACREPVLASTMQRLDDLMSLYVNMDPASNTDRMYRSKRNDEHVEIVQAYRDRDLDRAVRLNIEHIRRTVAGVLQARGATDGNGTPPTAEQ
jgi:DNA-binding GntR family transcriptional regulator